MKPRGIWSELGFIAEKIINAWFEYRRRRTLQKMIIALLLKGGIGILFISGGTQIIYQLAFGKVLDQNTLWVGFTLIFLALAFYFIERARAKVDLPDIDFEPNGSFFEPRRLPNDKGDAKYITGRDFYITAHFRVKTGRKKVSLCRAYMIAYHEGITCAGFRRQFCLDSKQILPHGSDPALYDDRFKSKTYTHNGNYEFNPPITIKRQDVINFDVRGHFSGPFQGQGDPFEFRNAELKLIVKYVVDGETKEATFNYGTDYYQNGLDRIEAISDIPFLSNRHINFLQRQGKIAIEERDELLSVSPEIRIRAAQGGDTPMVVHNRYRTPLQTIELVQRLWNNHSTLPIYEPEAIWQTRSGKAVKWGLDRLSPKTKY